GAARAAGGPVLSSLVVSGSASVARPASFVHEPWNVVPVVSVVWCWSAVHVIGPLIASAPVAPMMTSDVYQPLAPGVPAVTASAALGPDLSSFTVIGAASVESPAALVHEPCRSVPPVSVDSAWSAVQLTGPLTESAPVVPMVTSDVYQPLAPGVPAVTASAALGPDLSSFTVIGAASVFRPATGSLIVSAPVVRMATSEVYQPFVPSVPSADSAAVGLLASSLIVMGSASLERPASLVQEPLKSVPVVSVVSTWSSVQTTGPAMASAPEVATVTSDVYQPCALSVPPVTDSCAVGAVLSSLTVRGAAPAARPASFGHAPCSSVPVVSVATSWSALHVAGPLMESAPVVATVTSEVYQPCAPSV